LKKTANSDKNPKNLSLLFLVPNRDDRSLLNSIMDELPSLGVSYAIESYLPESKIFWGRPAVNLDRLGNSTFDAVVVLDLGYLSGESVKKKFPDTPLLLFAGDTPQSLQKQSLFSLAGNLLSILISRRRTPYLRRFGLLESAASYNLVLASDPGAVSEFEQLGIRAIWFPYWAEHSPKSDIKRQATSDKRQATTNTT
jgi:hypothetical protein